MLDISPNVKMILPGFTESVLNIHRYDNNSIHIHPKGIIEIQINDDNRKHALKRFYEKYWNEFEKTGLIESVGINGLKEDIGIGSHRFSTMDATFAKFLELQLEPIKPYLKNYSHVSRYFRFMKYTKGGEHYPHYDSNYESLVNKNWYTSYSLVMYFNDCEDGEIVFCHDSKKYDMPPHISQQRALAADWDRQCTEDEIFARFLPKAGRIVLFPHELCHSVLPFAGEERLMVRGDLYFEKKWI